VGANLGFNDCTYALSGGVSLDATTEERDESYFQDLNGDGLPELIKPAPGGFSVSYNTGTAFVPMVVPGGTGDNGNKIVSKTQNYGVGGSVEIPIWIPFTPLFLVINPGANMGRSMSRPSRRLRTSTGTDTPTTSTRTETAS
jgi:hypothetical protein